MMLFYWLAARRRRRMNSLKLPWYVFVYVHVVTCA
jgi:hypothetical protein